VSNTAAVAALWRREIVKFVRERSRLVGALVQPLGFWLVLGFGFGGAFAMPTGDVPYIEFLFPGIITLVLLFTAIFATISIVEERQSGLLQAALVAPISRLSVVMGNLLGGTTLAVVQAMLFLLLAPTISLTPSVTGILMILAGAFLTGLAFTALGFVIAWRMETTRGFHAVMNLFLLPMWFLSGAFFPVESAPQVFQYVMYLNPALYGVEVIRAGLYMPGMIPGAAVAPGIALAVCGGFAVALVALATWTVRRPLR
jgi:ABC-2 type transport system permease protein